MMKMNSNKSKMNDIRWKKIIVKCKINKIIVLKINKHNLKKKIKILGLKSKKKMQII